MGVRWERVFIAGRRILTNDANPLRGFRRPVVQAGGGGRENRAGRPMRGAGPSLGRWRGFGGTPVICLIRSRQILNRFIGRGRFALILKVFNRDRVIESGALPRHQL